MGDDADAVELGVELLAQIDADEFSVAEALDRIETITTDPHLTRTILTRAENQGVIDREDAVVRPKTTTTIDLDTNVVQREGEFDCRRCGATISTGHFVDLDPGEHGPFGSTCIRKVLGRD